MKLVNLTINILLILSLMGCSALFVSSTSDPKIKLAQSEDLIKNQRRPIPAQRLIIEALEIFKKEKDQFGIAASYRRYAFFLMSEAVTEWEGYFRKNGFIFEDINFDNRAEKSIEYFKKAVIIYEGNNEFGWLTKIYYKMGNISAYDANDIKSACNYYDKSLVVLKKYKKLHPDYIINLPKGFSSWAELMSFLKSEIKCV